MVGPEGMRAILDWELAHLGDPMEDLGWLCVPSWRFGMMDQPVGGFGQRRAPSGMPMRPLADSLTRIGRRSGNSSAP